MQPQHLSGPGRRPFRRRLPADRGASATPVEHTAEDQSVRGILAIGLVCRSGRIARHYWPLAGAACLRRRRRPGLAQQVNPANLASIPRERYLSARNRLELPAISGPLWNPLMATPSTYLDFEKPLAELETKIAELETAGGDVIDEEVGKLREKAAKQLETIYSHLNAWQKTQVARHPDRPHFMDYVDGLFDEFVELAGDRKFMNDDAIMGGLARFAAVRSSSSVTRRAATRPRASSTISAWASLRAIARRCA